MRLRVTLVATWICLAANPLVAQQTAPLDGFIKEVAYLWSGSDARGLAEMIPGQAQILLDAGQGMEAVESRHAAAALRALFSERQNVSVRPTRVTVAGSRPPRGFGEIIWSFRSRGSPGVESRSVFVGAVWSEQGWRISELRLMP